MGAELFQVEGRTGTRTDGRTDRERETDMTKLIIAFDSCANAPQNSGQICTKKTLFYERYIIRDVMVSQRFG